MIRRWTVGCGAVGCCLVAAALMAGCGSGPEEDGCMVDTSYDPEIDPAAFQASVDSEYFPLAVGTVLVYTEGPDSVRVAVLPDTKTILGVVCTVIRDQVFEDGEVTEDTYDWFAQDTLGNVWYFGEDTKELSGDAVVSTEGSWEAGVDGAKPGRIILADPTPGDLYRQEYYACVAEDMGEILELGASASVPYGSFEGCLKTRDFTPLEPGVNEHKYYAPGIGLVLTVDVGSGVREELVHVRSE
jgi:hypothetical protein